MTTPERVLLAGLSHETHTFVPGISTLPNFRVRRGDEVFQAASDASNLDGALEIARERKWELLPVIDLVGGAGPLVSDAVIDEFWRAVDAALTRELPRGIDGIYLILHGAMVSQSYPDVEGEVLRRIRARTGAPICGVLDLHGNFTQAMADYSDGLIVYRTNPHTDGRAAAMDGARLLDRLMRTGEKPLTVRAQPSLVLPPSGTGTAFDPMGSLEERARGIERANPEILAVNVFGGFSFADIPEAGVSFSAVTLGDPQAAHALLQELSALALSLKEEGNRPGMSLDDALADIKTRSHGPLIIVEPSDNIGGGAPGDLTNVLRGLLEHHIPNAAVAINDPQTVLELREQPIGALVHADIGGKSGVIGASPLPLDVEIISRSDGRFTLEDRHSHMSVYGEHVEMGPCIVVRHEGVKILLTSRATWPFDLAQWRSQGIQPESLFVIGVKAAIAHRQAYDPITVASYTVDTPGPCAENLRRLPYQHIRRPVYPLDEI